MPKRKSIALDRILLHNRFFCRSKTKRSFLLLFLVTPLLSILFTFQHFVLSKEKSLMKEEGIKKKYTHREKKKIERERERSESNHRGEERPFSSKIEWKKGGKNWNNRFIKSHETVIISDRAERTFWRCIGAEEKNSISQTICEHTIVKFLWASNHWDYHWEKTWKDLLRFHDCLPHLNRFPIVITKERASYFWIRGLDGTMDNRGSRSVVLNTFTTKERRKRKGSIDLPSSLRMETGHVIENERGRRLFLLETTSGYAKWACNVINCARVVRSMMLVEDLVR